MASFFPRVRVPPVLSSIFPLNRVFHILSGKWMATMSDTDHRPTPQNQCLLQAFEWNVPADQLHWQRLTAALPKLHDIGVSSLWSLTKRGR